MRILWCTHSLAGFEPESGGYNGSGWITSLLEEFRKIHNIDIGIAFFYGKATNPVVRDGVTYFPMAQGHVKTTDKLKSLFGKYDGWLKEETFHIRQLRQVIDTFRPDIIHVWGTETDMGLIAKEVSIPVIIHLQGLLNPYRNALCPPWVSRWNYICKDGFNPIKMLKSLNGLHYWDYKAERETRIFKVCKYYFGRTHWDKAICKFLSPGSMYYYCSEMLRKEFYADERWTLPKDRKFRIVSTLSPPLYKGMDMVLKTAQQLKSFANIDFEWNVIGVSQSMTAEHITAIKAEDVCVNCVGVKTAEEIKAIELESHLYFHPSYIDNSPNSVCEAQMLGMPVIAVNVGGLATILDNYSMGWLVPSNEPHMAASLITRLAENYTMLGEKRDYTYMRARQRHDKSSIIQSLLNAYKSIKR